MLVQSQAAHLLIGLPVMRSHSSIAAEAGCQVLLHILSAANMVPPQISLQCSGCILADHKNSLGCFCAVVLGLKRLNLGLAGVVYVFLDRWTFRDMASKDRKSSCQKMNYVQLVQFRVESGEQASHWTLPLRLAACLVTPKTELSGAYFVSMRGSDHCPLQDGLSTINNQQNHKSAAQSSS